MFMCLITKRAVFLSPLFQKGVEFRPGGMTRTLRLPLPASPIYIPPLPGIYADGTASLKNQIFYYISPKGGGSPGVTGFGN